MSKESSITPGPTTNDEDLRKVAELKGRLKSIQQSALSDGNEGARIPSVEIAQGRHKYVLIKATFLPTGEEQYIVTSKFRAAYHRDAAEPMIEKLEKSGAYSDIEVTGGGRIQYNVAEKKIDIFGYSYGFGLANHAISQRIIQEDPRYHDYTVTCSNDGY